MNIIISMISGISTAIIVILFSDYIELRVYSKRNSKNRFKYAVLSFILKSILPELSWRNPNDNDNDNDNEVKKVIQLIYLKPIYKEFHDALINKPPHIKFRNPPQEKLENASCKTYKKAEQRTICHVSMFLFNSSDFENIRPYSFLFEDNDNIFDFPAKFWIQWLKVNGINYYKYIQ